METEIEKWKKNKKLKSANQYPSIHVIDFSFRGSCLNWISQEYMGRQKSCNKYYEHEIDWSINQDRYWYELTTSARKGDQAIMVQGNQSLYEMRHASNFYVISCGQFERYFWASQFFPWPGDDQPLINRNRWAGRRDWPGRSLNQDLRFRIDAAGGSFPSWAIKPWPISIEILPSFFSTEIIIIYYIAKVNGEKCHLSWKSRDCIELWDSVFIARKQY